MKKPYLVINKKQRLLKLYDGATLIRQYEIALGCSSEQDKKVEGDGRTPEGIFYIFTKNEQSKFHLSLGLSYPNIEDAMRGLRENLISLEEYDAIAKAIAEKRMPPQKTALGGEIYIHGGGIETDWTRGCIALKNEEVKEIFDLIPVGAEVRIGK